ncbi:MAG: cbb3-type cytochrome c oxidase subunit I [Flavobacteriales bacterium]|nr:cbb3-type cytochrome c oxidase subunit I [Flavobacteriales bacterium]
MVMGIGRWQNPVVWFVVAALMLVTIGYFASVNMGMGYSALDITIQDTYFVVAHEHLIIAAALFCLVCAAVYWTFSRILRRPLNGTLGLIHAVLTTIGILVIYVPTHLVGATNSARRYYAYSEFDPIEHSGWIVNVNVIVAGLAFLFVFGQLILLVNVLRTLVSPTSA